jgi:hypothetical protein
MIELLKRSNRYAGHRSNFGSSDVNTAFINLSGTRAIAIRWDERCISR